MIRDIFEHFPLLDYLLLDFKRVLTLNESACRLIYQVLCKLSDSGKSVLFTQAQHLPLLRRYMKAKLEKDHDELFRHFDDHDPALEWCENQLLNGTLSGGLVERTV